MVKIGIFGFCLGVVLTGGIAEYVFHKKEKHIIQSLKVEEQTISKQRNAILLLVKLEKEQQETTQQATLLSDTWRKEAEVCD